MVMWGQILFGLLVTSSVVGTYIYDFDRHHIFNASWSPHARFHAACFAILSMGVHLIAGVLIFWLPFGNKGTFLISSALLAMNGGTLLIASLVNGTSTNAGPHEKVWKQQPISIWMVGVYFVVIAAGLLLGLSN